MKWMQSRCYINHRFNNCTCVTFINFSRMLPDYSDICNYGPLVHRVTLGASMRWQKLIYLRYCTLCAWVKTSFGLTNWFSQTSRCVLEAKVGRQGHPLVRPVVSFHYRYKKKSLNHSIRTVMSKCPYWKKNNSQYSNLVTNHVRNGNTGFQVQLLVHVLSYKLSLWKQKKNMSFITQHNKNV